LIAWAVFLLLPTLGFLAGAVATIRVNHLLGLVLAALAAGFAITARLLYDRHRFRARGKGPGWD
jgi:membrane protein DedA with SNARE-associated domain